MLKCRCVNTKRTEKKIENWNCIKIVWKVKILPIDFRTTVYRRKKNFEKAQGKIANIKWIIVISKTKEDSPIFCVMKKYSFCHQFCFKNTPHVTVVSHFLIIAFPHTSFFYSFGNTVSQKHINLAQYPNKKILTEKNQEIASYIMSGLC